MSDEAKRAVTASRWWRRLSPVWLIPLAVVMVGGWLLYQNTLSRGPEVTLRLDNAEGLEAGKTAVKVRNVTVGRVEEVRLSSDYRRAIATVQMNPGTARLLVKDSQFWVVKPRVSRRGVSGLGTILSGAYLRLRPGEADEPRRRFRVPDHPPVSHEVPGLSLILTSREDASLNVGDPILYEGRPVGQIDRARFDTGDREMRYGIFVRSPYDQLITRNTRFWKRSGVEVQVGSEGIRLQTGSLQSMLLGGIAFGVPEGVPPGPAVTKGSRFRLFASRSIARQERFDRRIRYLALFRDSVRGLHRGAPVEYRGIRVGTVSEVPYRPEEGILSLSEGARIPVLLSIEPQRLDVSASPGDRVDLGLWRGRLNELFRRGLHASIRPANLVTGAMYVDLQYGDPRASYEPERRQGHPVFPSRPGGFTNIERKVARLLDKLNDLQLGSLVREMKGAMRDSSKTLERTRTVMENLNELLESDTARGLPGELRGALRDVRDTLRAYQRGEPAYENLRRSLERLNSVLEDVAPLARTLRRQPDALIYGREAQPDPVPRAAP